MTDITGRALLMCVMCAMLCSGCVRLFGGTKWFIEGDFIDGRLQYTDATERVIDRIELGMSFEEAEKLVPLPRAFVLPLKYSDEAVETVAHIRRNQLGAFPARVDVGRRFDRMLADKGEITQDEWRGFVFCYPKDGYDLPKFQRWFLLGSVHSDVILDGSYRAYFYRTMRIYRSPHGDPGDAYIVLLVSPDGKVVGKKGSVGYTRKGGVLRIILKLGVLMP
jgi:hypothetical protein